MGESGLDGETDLVPACASRKSRRAGEGPKKRANAEKKKCTESVCVDSLSARRMDRKEKFSVANRIRYAFLEERLDADGRSPGDEEYDPRTLKIPLNALANMTSFERQYWEIKSGVFDCLVFFNKGKFYELMELDADVVERELGLAPTERAGMKMCGLPVSSFAKYASKLVARGYKVCQVEQGDGEGEGGMMKRVVERIITPGTVVDPEFLEEDGGRSTRYLMSVSSEGEGSIGVCLLNAAVASFSIGELKKTSDFCALMSEFRPCEVLYARLERGSLPMSVVRRRMASGTLLSERRAESCWSGERVARYIDADYRWQNERARRRWQNAVSACGARARRAVGACLAYLSELKMEWLLNQGCVRLLNGSIRDGSTSDDSLRDDSCLRRLSIDWRVLEHLELVENGFDGGARGTVLEQLDAAVTPCGRRLLREWVCHPLAELDEILDRQESVSEILRDGELQALLREKLRGLPDMERLLSRARSGRLRARELARWARAVERVAELSRGLEAHYRDKNGRGWNGPVSGNRLERCAERLFLDRPKDDGSSWCAEMEVEWLLKSFDLEVAEAEDRVVPRCADRYDDALRAVSEIESELDAIVSSYQSHYGGDTSVRLVEVGGAGRQATLIHVPGALVDKYGAPPCFVKQKSTQKFTRFWTESLGAKSDSLAEARRLVWQIESEELRNHLDRIDGGAECWWMPWVRAVAEIDCLLSLAQASNASIDQQCRPVFCDSEEHDSATERSGRTSSSFFHARSLVHPCLFNQTSFTNGRFIPNDVSLGQAPNSPQILLLTGPNMGGKSTLLRQVGVAVIMAQIGCWVYAKECRLTVFDQIFTRVGSRDSIFEGKSTLFVELEEAGFILGCATPRSLVIMDELGRGTSSVEGYAIAYATLDALVRKQCCVLFSTHSHLLISEILGNDRLKRFICLCHMSALTDVHGARREITPLYRMVPGECRGSYGLAVARMAGIPEAVIQRAKACSDSYLSEHRLKLASLRQLTHAFLASASHRREMAAPSLSS
ncbi:uncharacterized protein LOC126311182 [Schistocerca gregaria]|uniref:uncharacterized protein LOC126311182 n=1 Tax=Schistocerca gregaria TaxID=7010 RepID=UPI00211F2E5F|nr:uncharacterized protein LOC126311182 [Schistocerca gregaria]